MFIYRKINSYRQQEEEGRKKRNTKENWDKILMWNKRLFFMNTVYTSLYFMGSCVNKANQLNKTFFFTKSTSFLYAVYDRFKLARVVLYQWFYRLFFFVFLFFFFFTLISYTFRFCYIKNKKGLGHLSNKRFYNSKHLIGQTSISFFTITGIKISLNLNHYQPFC